MNTITIRKDNKKLLYGVDIMLIFIIGLSFYLMIMNTKMKLVGILEAFLFFASILVFILFQVDSIKKNKETLEIETNKIPYYYSEYKNNRLLKILFPILTYLEMPFIFLIFYVYWFNIDYSSLYSGYTMFIGIAIIVTDFVFVIREIMNINKKDKIEINQANKFNMLGKRILFLGVFFIWILYNCGILWTDFTYFEMTYSQLISFELTGLFSLLIMLINVFLRKLYYSKFDFKTVNAEAFDVSLLFKLGEGTYASVYRITLPSNNKKYAVKKLKSTSEDDIERFENEYRLMHTLNHPNLRKAYEYDKTNKQYLMDYVDYTLDDYIYSRALDENDKKDLIMQLCDGMIYLHKNGIMHRDLSFSNVMINESMTRPTLIISDFGLSKDIRNKKTNSFTQIKGTFFDPTLEKFKDFNELNDIYSLANIINFIFYGKDVIVNDGSKFSEIIKKCLDLNLDNRIQSVEELKRVLGEILW